MKRNDEVLKIFLSLSPEKYQMFLNFATSTGLMMPFSKL